MALPDPELDLLRELLAEDPTDEVFLQVGEELVRRGAFEEAVVVLTAGLEAHPQESSGWRLLARAAVEEGHPDRALIALQCSGPIETTDAARVEILALEATGKAEAAREKAAAFLEAHPDDPEITTAMERMHAPDPEPGYRSVDPFVSVARAEQYVALGRTDRAVRAFRRILFHNPGNRALEARLMQLQSQPYQQGPDDLSEELDDPSVRPPDLTMPAPALQHVDADEELTEPVILASEVMAYARRAREQASGVGRVVATQGPSGDLPTEDDVDPSTDEEKLSRLEAKGELGELARKKARRRRRSLLRR